MPPRSSAHTREDLRLTFLDHRSPSVGSERSKSSAQDGPSRTTRLSRVTTGGGYIAKTADGSRVAVAGRNSLRILKLSTPDDSGVPRFEASRNFWDHSGLKAASGHTDVVWARGLYSSKILTGSRNGELRLWDLQKNGPNKLETTSRSHLRAIHKLALSAHLPHYCITGSADGDMRAWDLRDIHRKVLRIPFPTAVRAAVFSPDSTHALQIALGLDDGSLHRWDLRMGARGALDRLPVAHVGPILSLDWVPASGAPSSSSPSSSVVDGDGTLAAFNTPVDRERGGWIASAGLDKTIKVWPAASGGILPSQPFYTLSSVYPVRRIQFRPGHATELVSVSHTDQGSISDDPIGTDTPPEVVPCANEIVQIWDVRRENLPKWVVPTNMPDGGISDIGWGDSRVLWAQHASGAFAQIDICNLPAPLKAAVRSTVAWGPTGALAFALDVPNEKEIPFDERESPTRDAVFGEIGPKSLGEPPYRPITQNAGVITFESELGALDRFIACAKSYRIQGSEQRELCLHNAGVADQSGNQQAAEIWAFAASLLEDVVPSLPKIITSPVPPALPHSISAPSAIPTISPPSLKPPTRRSTTEATPTKLIASQAAKRILSSNNPPSHRSSPGLTPSPTGSPSPLRRTIHLPTLPLIDSSTFSRPGSTASTPLRERPALFRYPTGFDPNARRPSLTPSLLSTTSHRSRSPSERAMSASFKHRVGEGALDDSSDEEDAAAAEAGDEQDEGDDDEDDPVTPMRTPLRTKPNAVAFSPFIRNSWAPGVDRDGSSSEDIASSQPHPSSYQRRSTLRKRKDRRESFGMFAETGFLAAPSSAPKLTHQISASTINTVTAGTEMGVSVNTVTGTLGRERSANVSMDPSEEQTSAGEETDDEAFMRFTRAEQEKIVAEEKKLREMGWMSLKENLVSLADEGDVQTCAIFGIVCREELGLSQAKLSRFVEAYMDMLMRLQFHTSAAYLRKFSGLEDLRSHTTINTTIYTACGRCRKPIISPAPHVDSTRGKPAGAFSFCIRCREFMICSVCHLPVKGLSTTCSICGHGGHWTCYRRVRAEQSPVEKTHEGHERHESAPRSPPRTRANSDITGMPEGEQTFTQTRGREGPGLGPSDSASRSGDRKGTTLVGYQCVAGCGHWCVMGARES